MSSNTDNGEPRFTDFRIVQRRQKALDVDLFEPGWEGAKAQRWSHAASTAGLLEILMLFPLGITLLPTIVKACRVWGGESSASQRAANMHAFVGWSGALLVVVLVMCALAGLFWWGDRKETELGKFKLSCSIKWGMLRLPGARFGVVGGLVRRGKHFENDLVWHLRHVEGKDRVEAAEYLHRAWRRQVKQDEAEGAKKARQKEAEAARERRDLEQIRAGIQAANGYFRVRPLLDRAHALETGLSMRQRSRLKAIAEEIAQLGSRVGPQDEVSLGSIKGSLESTAAALEAMGKGDGFKEARAALDHQLDLAELQLGKVRERADGALQDQVQASSLFLEGKASQGIHV